MIWKENFEIMIDFYKDKDVNFTVDVFQFNHNYTIDLTNETIEVLNKINPKDTVVETKFRPQIKNNPDKKDPPKNGPCWVLTIIKIWMK